MKQDESVDPMGATFSTVVRICTLVGLLVMILFGLLYLFGLNPYMDIDSVVKHWGKPAYKFWHDTKGNEVNNYSWFLSHLGKMDSLSMIGISFLSLAPLVSVLFIVLRAKKIYKIALLILALELIFSIIKPIIL